MTVKVLGVDYEIVESNRVDDTNLENADGYCDTSSKKIVIDEFQQRENSKENLEQYKQSVIRHEIIHAFLYESGLDGESWARNEEIVDWMAIQFPKLHKAFKSVEAL